MSTKIIDGVGFGVYGPEEDYLLLLDENGERTVGASNMLPEHGRVSWARIEAMTGGFGEESARILAEEVRDAPRGIPLLAHRIRITVEAEPLTREETDALIERRRAREEAERAEEGAQP